MESDSNSPYLHKLSKQEKPRQTGMLNKTTRKVNCVKVEQTARIRIRYTLNQTALNSHVDTHQKLRSRA